MPRTLPPMPPPLPLPPTVLQRAIAPPVGGKRAGKQLARQELFALRQEVAALAGEVKSLGQLYEDLALLVETYVAPKGPAG